MKPGVLDLISRLTTRERLLIAWNRRAAMEESPDKLAALVDAVPACDSPGRSHTV